MKITKIFLFVILSLIIFAGFVSAQTTIVDPINAGSFGNLLTRIANGVTGLVATLSGIMIIVAGMMYLTSAGDTQKMNTAKTALKYAIIGIVLSLLAIPIVEVIKEVLSGS